MNGDPRGPNNDAGGHTTHEAGLSLWMEIPQSTAPDSSLPRSAASSLSDVFGSTSSAKAEPPHDTENTSNTGTSSPSAAHTNQLKDLLSIDWAAGRERSRRIRLYKKTGFVAWLFQTFYSIQGWIVLLVIGSLCGMFAVMIEHMAQWYNGLRDGFCKTSPLLSYETCCMVHDHGYHCENWVMWSELVPISADWLQYIFGTFMFFVTMATMMAMATFVVKTWAPFAAGGGIPEIKTILGGYVIPKFLGFRVLMLKSLTLPLVIGAGLMVGQEGPMVHISCCIGNVCSRMFAKYRNNEAKKREVLSACCAAAIAVAFGAPVGGVLFSLEEASSYFPPRTLWRSLFCSLMGVLTVKVLNPNTLSLLNVTHDQDYLWFELIPLCLLGVLGGVFGALFIKSGVAYSNLRRRTFIKQFPVLESVLVILLTALLTFWNPISRLSNHETLRLLFRECAYGTEPHCNWTIPATLLLLVCCVVKFFLFVLSSTLRVPAGLFVPSLTIGAMIGYLVGLLVKFLQETFSDLPIFMECPSSGLCIVPGVYALVGAAVLLGGVTRITVSIVVIVLEVTGGLSYAVPIMLAVLIAKWVGDLFGHESIYELMIHINKYPYLDNKVEIDIDGEARDMMRHVDNMSVISLRGSSIETLQQAIKTQPRGNLGFAIVTDADSLLLAGFIYSDSLNEAITHALKLPDVTPATLTTFSNTDFNVPGVLNLSDFLDSNSVHILDETPIYQVYDLFKAMGLRYILVTCEGSLSGIITKQDCLEFFARMRHNRKKNQKREPVYADSDLKTNKNVLGSRVSLIEPFLVNHQHHKPHSSHTVSGSSSFDSKDIEAETNSAHFAHNAAVTAHDGEKTPHVEQPTSFRDHDLL